ncbi:MAG: aminoacyl-tRNA hydrolase [Peptoniphilaceae bacterium]|nr:aminoacyl-tRNA hydrolase [Peptoniphilaceae bacterium]MDD7383353.1 aminoacyl-tRNA hydrolase [Peptoniphilaceae bacterium]MDY3738276.1 aminoacyl-tRNA hydrolase [Peptoniphilaceae bacterium]
MYFIFGLGNPGFQYDNTRHNVGFETLDFVAKKHDIKINRLRFKGLFGRGKISNEDVMLIKPQTFMNNSGECVKEIFDFYKPEKKEIIIILDDVEIKFATLRIRKKGSHGNHNGMRSIIDNLGFDDITRIKVAVGNKPEKLDMVKHVLGTYTESEQKIVNKEIELASDAVEEIISEGVDKAMSLYNSKNLL